MTVTSPVRMLLRRLAASPSFTSISVLTLAIGISANLAIFTIVNAVLLRPLPLPDADRLIILTHNAPGMVQLDELPMSDALYFLYAREVRTLDGVALVSEHQASFTGAENTQRVESAFVTPSFFEVVRTPPRLGRVFTAEDGRPGAPPVTVLSDGLWQARFGGDTGVIGRVVEIDGDRVEIVGVMPATLTFPTPETQLWQPHHLDENEVQLGISAAWDSHASGPTIPPSDYRQSWPAWRRTSSSCFRTKGRPRFWSMPGSDRRSNRSASSSSATSRRCSGSCSAQSASCC